MKVIENTIDSENLRTPISHADLESEMSNCEFAKVNGHQSNKTSSTEMTAIETVAKINNFPSGNHNKIASPSKCNGNMNDFYDDISDDDYQLVLESSSDEGRSPSKKIDEETISAPQIVQEIESLLGIDANSIAIDEELEKELVSNDSVLPNGKDEDNEANGEVTSKLPREIKYVFEEPVEESLHKKEESEKQKQDKHKENKSEATECASSPNMNVVFDEIEITTDSIDVQESTVVKVDDNTQVKYSNEVSDMKDSKTAVSHSSRVSCTVKNTTKDSFISEEYKMFDENVNIDQSENKLQEGDKKIEKLLGSETDSIQEKTDKLVDEEEEEGIPLTQSSTISGSSIEWTVLDSVESPEDEKKIDEEEKHTSPYTRSLEASSGQRNKLIEYMDEDSRSEPVEDVGVNIVSERQDKEIEAVPNVSEYEAYKNKDVDSMLDSQTEENEDLDLMSFSQVEEKNYFDTISEIQPEESENIDPMSSSQAKENDHLNTIIDDQTEECEKVEPMSISEADENDYLNTITDYEIEENDNVDPILNSKAEENDYLDTISDSQTEEKEKVDPIPNSKAEENDCLDTISDNQTEEKVDPIPNSKAEENDYLDTISDLQPEGTKNLVSSIQAEENDNLDGISHNKTEQNDNVQSASKATENIIATSSLNFEGGRKRTASDEEEVEKEPKKLKLDKEESTIVESTSKVSKRLSENIDGFDTKRLRLSYTVPVESREDDVVSDKVVSEISANISAEVTEDERRDEKDEPRSDVNSTKLDEVEEDLCKKIITTGDINEKSVVELAKIENGDKSAVSIKNKVTSIKLTKDENDGPADSSSSDPFCEVSSSSTVKHMNDVFESEKSVENIQSNEVDSAFKDNKQSSDADIEVDKKCSQSPNDSSEKSLKTLAQLENCSPSPNVVSTSEKLTEERSIGENKSKNSEVVLDQKVEYESRELKSEVHNANKENVEVEVSSLDLEVCKMEEDSVDDDIKSKHTREPRLRDNIDKSDTEETATPSNKAIPNAMKVDKDVKNEIADKNEESKPVELNLDIIQKTKTKSSHSLKTLESSHSHKESEPSNSDKGSKSPNLHKHANSYALKESESSNSSKNAKSSYSHKESESSLLCKESELPISHKEPKSSLAHKEPEKSIKKTGEMIGNHSKTSKSPFDLLKKNMEEKKPESKILTNLDKCIENVVEKARKDSGKALPFMKKFHNKKITKLTRTELEETVVMKICEAITDRSDIGQMRLRCKTLEQNNELWRKKAMQFEKQCRELEMVLKRFMAEVAVLKRDNQNRLPLPIKVTRSVGLQVVLASSMNGTLVSSKNKTNTEQPKNEVSKTPQIHQQHQQPMRAKPVDREVVKTTTFTPPMHTSAPRGRGRPSKLPLNAVASKSTGSTTPQAKATPPSTPVKSSTTKIIPTPTKDLEVIDLTEKEEKEKAPSQSPAGGGQIRVTPSTQVCFVQQSTTQPQPSPQPMAYLVQKGQRQQFLVTTSSSSPPRTGTTPGVNNRQSNPLALPVFRSGGQIIPVQNSPQSSPQVGLRNNTTNTTTPTTTTVANTRQVPQAIRIRAPPVLAKHPAPLPSSPTPVHKTGFKQPPSRPQLKIAKTVNGIMLSWSMSLSKEMEEMASYQLYAYQEGLQPPSTNLWKKVGDVKALPLPMACTLTQFIEDHKYHFAVRAVDVRGRIGPFSMPGTILLTK